VIRQSLRKTVLKLGGALGGAFPDRPRRPIFVVGYNNSGKSLIVTFLTRTPHVKLFPGEGNDTLWFRGAYPWVQLQTPTPPLWFSPERFLDYALRSRSTDLVTARHRLGLYEALRARSQRVVNDSGMLAALAPMLLERFPDAQIIHVVRDGRVVSALSAWKTMGLIDRYRERYKSSGCPTDLPGVLLAQARYWTWTLDRVGECKEMAPGQVLEVRYEDWCAQPQAFLRRICGFLELPEDVDLADSVEDIADQNPQVLSRIPHDQLRSITAVQTVHLERYGYETGS
jgi:hypothetical protein